MLGAIIGDIVGSRFEFNNHRSKEFELFTEDCFVTDDSIMTLAVAKGIMEADKIRALTNGVYDHGFHNQLIVQTVKYMLQIGRKYPHCGYGGMFHKWIFSDNPKPYNSFGNGGAMRVSPVGFFAQDEYELKEIAETVTAITHNHIEGIKGATATAVAIYMAKNGALIKEIRERIIKEFYPLDFKIDDIRNTYQFNETSQETVPQAIKCFLESTSFEDAIRIAISLGGDSDTIGAITGSIAEAYYGIPENIKEKALGYLNKELLGIYNEWNKFILLRDNLKGSIIDFPNFKELKDSIEKLRTELSILYLEHDELIYVECKNIEMSYMLTIGGLEYKAYEIECAILRLKRKIELIQAQKNRQEKIILSKIEETLDIEFAEYKEKIEEELDKMNEAIERNSGEMLSKKESLELKKLYRRIVKELHPDIHPDISQGKIQLFHNAVSAYENGDIEGLRIISTMVTRLDLPEDIPDVISQMMKEKERLMEFIEKVKINIAEIKLDYPYMLKSLLQSLEKVEERKSQLTASISQLRKTYAIYNNKVKEMLR